MLPLHLNFKDKLNSKKREQLFWAKERPEEGWGHKCYSES